MLRDFLSRIGIIILVSSDIVAAFLATGNLMSVFLVIAVLVVGVAALFFFDFLSLHAIPVQKCRSIEGNRLVKDFEAIKRKYESANKQCPKIKLYINPSPTRNAFSLGKKITVTRGLMEENDSVIQAVLSHELAHTLHYDAYFSALLQVNILAACCIFLIVEFGAVLIFGFLLFILLCMACSRFAAITITGIITKLIRGFSRLFLRVLVLLHSIVAAIFFRQQEYSADSFTVKLGTSLPMKLFLEDLAQTEGVEVSLMERLLSDHPDPYARIANIEKTESQATQIQVI